MKQHYLVIDIEFCHDCNNCFVSCKDEYVMNAWLPYSEEQPRHGHRWMNVLRKERGQFPRVEANFLPMPCQHCQDAPCAKASPDAVSIREDGIVLIDPVKAKGDKALANSCPYGAIYWNEEKEIPQKCTFCAHLLDGDWQCPRCVHSCPTGVLQYYHEEPADFEKIIADLGLETYLPQLNTKPRVYYQNLQKFTTNFIAGGLLKNGECAEGVTVSLLGAEGTRSQTTNFFGDFKFDGLKPGEYTITASRKELMTVSIDTSLNAGNIETEI